MASSEQLRERGSVCALQGDGGDRKTDAESGKDELAEQEKIQGGEVKRIKDKCLTFFDAIVTKHTFWQNV